MNLPKPLKRRLQKKETDSDLLIIFKSQAGKQMKRLTSLIMVLGLLVIALSANAQSYKFLPKKTHLLTEEELKDKRISTTLPIYTQKGEKLDPVEAMRLVGSPDFTMEVYGDSAGTPKAVLFRASSEEEKEAKLAMFMAMDKTGNWKNKPAPNFAAMSMDGIGLNLAEMKGSVVAINFWYIGCKPCIMEMPELNELVEKYKGQNVKFVAIALDSKERLIPFLQRMAFDYEIIPNGRNLAGIYDVSGYPTHFLVNEEGKVTFYQKGYNGALVSILDRRIEKLLSVKKK